jgi:hypothetical protein
LRANGSRECAPDDKLREAIHASHAEERMDHFVASLLATTEKHSFAISQHVCSSFCYQLPAF